MTVNIAILGAGSVGAKHAAAVRAANANISCIIDVDPVRGRALAKESDAPYSDDVRSALGDATLDGVVICVPNCYHKELAIEALRAGKDVLLEKPMALNEAECKAINEVARKAGRLLQLGFVHRYTAVGQLAKKIALAGTLGDVYHVKAHLYLRRGIPGLGKWFTTKRLSGGGALIDVGVHLLDLALFVLDFPAVESVLGQVYANFGSRLDGYVYESMWAGPPDLEGVFDVEDSAHAMIRFASGTTLDLQVAWAGNFPEIGLPTSMMGFFGERGGITFELFGGHINHSHEKDGAIVDNRISAPETDFYRDQLADFVEGIQTRRILGPTGEQGQIVQSIVDQIYRSSRPLGAVDPVPALH